MADPFEGVVGLLDEELDLHRRLLALAREAQRAIVRGVASDLSEIVRRQEATVGEIRAVEQARQGLVQLVAEREGCDPGDLPLSRLIVKAEPGVAVRLERQREALLSVLQEMADVNSANALLLRDYITYLRTMVDMVTQAADRATYGGNCREGQAFSLLLDRTT